MEIKGTERVLVCPLGWGLGHASRMVPVVTFLLRKGCTVIIAGDASTNEFVKKRFPSVECIHFPSFSVRLSSSRFQILYLALVAIKVFLRTASEKREFRQILEKHSINLTISDNRYGLFSNQIPCVLVTHQLSPIFPKPFGFLKRVGERFVRRHAEQFTECWIPDNPEGFSFSGKLSQPQRLPKNSIRIGLLSRFSELKNVEADKRWELVAMVSGPEPHRTILEQQVVKLSVREKVKTLIIAGQPLNNSTFQLNEYVTIEPNLDDESIAKVLQGAKFVICRAGYSTIMDLLALNRSALLVPTPGQTEQEYLAKRMKSSTIFQIINQKNVSNLSLVQFEGSDFSPGTTNRFFPKTNY